MFFKNSGIGVAGDKIGINKHSITLKVNDKLTLDLSVATMFITDINSDSFGIIHKQYSLLNHIGNYKNVSIEEGIPNMLNVYKDKMEPNKKITLENKSINTMVLNVLIIK